MNKLKIVAIILCFMGAVLELLDGNFTACLWAICAGSWAVSSFCGDKIIENLMNLVEQMEKPSLTSFYQDTEEILKITKEGFYYKGERVDDIHNVYERFNEWLKVARKEL